MALVDYRGFRLIAMSILPIDSSTIRTGSNNYGQAVHDDVSERDKTALETMAARLNIKVGGCGALPLLALTHPPRSFSRTIVASATAVLPRCTGLLISKDTWPPMDASTCLTLAESCRPRRPSRA